MSSCAASPHGLTQQWESLTILQVTACLLGALLALCLLVITWKNSRDLRILRDQLSLLLENHRVSNTPVIISEPAVFSESVQRQVHLATQHLRNPERHAAVPGPKDPGSD